MKPVPDQISATSRATCKTCKVERDRARYRRTYYNRAGVREGERLCWWCGLPKPIGDAIKPNADYCTACKVKRKRVKVRVRYRQRQQRMTDVEREEARAKDAAWARVKRSTPEGRARDRAAVHRWRERHPEEYRKSLQETRARIMADPRKHEADLSNRRINYRLRAARNGQPIPPMREETYANGNGKAKLNGRRYFPTGPIAALISEWMGELSGVPLGNSDYRSANSVYGAGFLHLAELCGLPDRTLRAICFERPTVQYATLDVICTALDTPIASLYPEAR